MISISILANDDNNNINYKINNNQQSFGRGKNLRFFDNFLFFIQHRLGGGFFYTYRILVMLFLEKEEEKGAFKD